MRTLVRKGRAGLKERKGALDRGLNADLLVLDTARLEQSCRSTLVLPLQSSVATIFFK